MFAVVPKELPSVNYWSEKHKLPELSGIYFVIRHDEAIAYVGQALSLKSRWSGAHGVKLKISKHAGKHRIHYLGCDISDLGKCEAYFIHKYTPPLNITYPKIQTHELIRMAESGALSYKEALITLAKVTEEFCGNVEKQIQESSRLEQEQRQVYQGTVQLLAELFANNLKTLTETVSTPDPCHLDMLIEACDALVHSKTRVLELEARVKELEAMNIQIDANSRN